MNCSTCGTQLPQGAANCPQCGATTPYYYSHARIAPNDPTVVSAPDADAQQPLPPTMYGSPSYQNPYESYNVAPPAPPPPSPQRPGNRIGIIVGIVLLVLLLIGGGVFAWLEYSSARNAAAAAALATTTAHTNATATTQAIATATANFTAKGTFTRFSRTITNVRQDGSNRVYSITDQEVDYGDVTGSYTTELTSILHADNTSNFSATSTCTCTVAGKSGTLMWSFSGTSTANDSFQGQVFNFQGTGDLAKLHGQGAFQGQGVHGTYSDVLHFDA